MENTTSYYDRINRRIRNSVTLKLLSMGILMLLLLIPAAMIQELIYEREFTRQAAISEVSSKWGNAQTLAGPVLIIPYNVYRTTEDDRVVETTAYAYFLPETLRVEGKVTPETRYRGLYEVVVYTTTMSYAGHFAPPDFSDWDIDPKDILWDDATLAVGISDLRGINESIKLRWNNAPFDVDPGVEPRTVIDAGVSVPVPVSATPPESGRYDVAFEVNLNGSDGLHFVPLGKETRVHLASSWSTPSFNGAFLPDTRTVTEEGFAADWRVLHLNRNYPQQWRGGGVDLDESAFGVNLLLPVDQYQKSMRAAKYAILVIAFTFLTFFLTEVRNREKRAHPFQYILVGLALCLFYALLVSLSEHVTFNAAYALAGFATIGAVTTYTRSIFKTRSLSLLTGLVLSVLYGFVFIILQLEDYALLVGTVGLFVALSLTMYLTRNIDWYASGEAE